MSAGERLVCLFNLGRSEARVALPGQFNVTALSGHGFGGELEAGGAVRLSAGDACFGVLA